MCGRVFEQVSLALLNLIFTYAYKKARILCIIFAITLDFKTIKDFSVFNLEV